MVFFQILARDIDPSKNDFQFIEKSGGKPTAVLLKFSTSVLASMISWCMAGGIIGAVSASRANHNLRQGGKAQGDASQNARGNLNSEEAFMWGSGMYGLYLASSSALGGMGLFGEKMKNYYRTIYKTPKLLIASLPLSIGSCLASGYVATKMVPWIRQQQLSNSSEE